MIVLDAAVLIAYLDPNDSHHQRAVELLAANAGEQLAMSEINLAEALVGPIRAGRLADALTAILVLDLAELPVGPNAAVNLAALRHESGVKMPGCCALLAAREHSAALVTFDDRLARSAVSLGIEVLSRTAPGP